MIGPARVTDLKFYLSPPHLLHSSYTDLVTDTQTHKTISHLWQIASLFPILHLLSIHALWM